MYAQKFKELDVIEYVADLIVFLSDILFEF